MYVMLLLFVVGVSTLVLILSLRHTNEPDEEEVENALDALLMYDMDEEDD